MPYGKKKHPQTHNYIHNRVTVQRGAEADQDTIHIDFLCCSCVSQTKTQAVFTLIFFVVSVSYRPRHKQYSHWFSLLFLCLTDQDTSSIHIDFLYCFCVLQTKTQAVFTLIFFIVSVSYRPRHKQYSHWFSLLFLCLTDQDTSSIHIDFLYCSCVLQTKTQAVFTLIFFIVPVSYRPRHKQY